MQIALRRVENIVESKEFVNRRNSSTRHYEFVVTKCIAMCETECKLQLFGSALRIYSTYAAERAKAQKHPRCR